MNAYEIFESIRNNLNEIKAAQWQDLEILKIMNNTQDELAAKFYSTRGDWFTAEEDLLVGYSCTLPLDFRKFLVLKNPNNEEYVYLNAVANGESLKISNGKSCWFIGNTLQANFDLYGWVLLYQRNVKKLHFGLAGSASGVNTLEFQSDLRPINKTDYYIGQVVLIPGTIEEVALTAYNGSTRIATIAGTAAENDPYGTVSDLPDLAENVFILKSTLRCLAKPSSSIDTKYYQQFASLYQEANIEFVKDLSSRNAGHQFIG